MRPTPSRAARALVLCLFPLALTLGCHSPSTSASSASPATPATPVAAADATSPSMWAGHLVYTRVGMKFESRNGAWYRYSTNHIGLPMNIPPGSQLTVQAVLDSIVRLSDPKLGEMRIDFVQRHNRMDRDAWLARQFSATPVELPGNLTDAERKAVAEGSYAVGMSRAALFLAIGYPPASLTPSFDARELTYEVKRFNKLVFVFGDDDRVQSIRD